LDELKTAQKEAIELGSKIATKTFTWEPKYLGKQVQKIVVVEKTKTIGELIEALKLEYLKNKPTNTPKT
jgi:hypothetical protein